MATRARAAERSDALSSLTDSVVEASTYSSIANGLGGAPGVVSGSSANQACTAGLNSGRNRSNKNPEYCSGSGTYGSGRTASPSSCRAPSQSVNSMTSIVVCWPARVAAWLDSARSREAALYAMACTPPHWLLWKADHAVRTVATPRRIVAMRSRWRYQPDCVTCAGSAVSANCPPPRFPAA